MRRKVENQAVENLFSKVVNGEEVYRWSDEVPLDEWRQVFQDFQSFVYKSSANRKLDLGCLISLGLGILDREKLWDECIRFTELVLADADYRDNPHEVVRAHWYKAQSLIRLGKQDEAFSYYLEQIRAMPKGLDRRWAFMLGIHLFIEVKPFNRAGERDGRDAKTIAPPEVVHFARELAKAHYGHRKLPVPLRDHAEEKSFTWAQVHKALVSL